MYLRRTESGWSAMAPAKLNLSLEILGRREDGFHELESLMVPIQIYDSLDFQAITPNGRDMAPLLFQLRSSALKSGPLKKKSSAQDEKKTPEEAAVPNDATNLVIRAVSLLRARSGCEQGAKIRLVKRIPSQAGLGGGSSDAAAALQLANKAWGLGWSTKKLAELGAELGSDIPFFFANSAAICRGRGEIVEVLPPIRLHAVLVKPAWGLSTPKVFQALDAPRYVAADYKSSCSVTPSCGTHRDEVTFASEFNTPALKTTELKASEKDIFKNKASRSKASCEEIEKTKRTARTEKTQALLKQLQLGKADLGRFMTNRLQEAAEQLAPNVAQLKAIFNRQDCLGHQLSGSGSAYFGLCRSQNHSRQIAARLRSQHLGDVFSVSSYR